ncbi:hypothetical protein H5410_030364 [Solanum commersonii]|uniref:Uncharacterized protein n=1 Tax=Solanum commersonii TaxID=4109 RepID=A0A9J5YFH0_SOLCO|nr:hypothetical protein H5410_030364 [Solanum commersonii]
MDYSRDDIDGLLNDQFRDVAQAEGVYDARNNDECDPSDTETVSSFPNKGVLLRAKKTDPFILDNESLSQAHAYLLGNCDEVQEYISGVTLVASTTSFASSKDKNPIAADLTYYGRIVDIVELDNYGHFKVVQFK